MSKCYSYSLPFAAGLLALTSFAGHAATPAEAGSEGPGIVHESHVPAGGHEPPGTVLRNPDHGSAAAAKNGEMLFSSMHCDGCHSGAGAGAVGPSLADGRWIFGGSDSAVFQSIFYGRPHGMPAFGAVLGDKGVWAILTYLRTLSPPSNMPTESWEGH